MLKKLFLVILVIGTALIGNAQIKTPQPSPTTKIEQVVGLTDVTLEYSRPSMRGRTIFGDLVPYGQVWRTGANSNTKITFSTNVVFDSKELKKGTYAIYTVPNEKNWDIIFYSDATNWGNPQKWDENNVALKISAEVHKSNSKIETFTITFNDLTSNSGVLGFLWENTYVGLPFEVPTDKIAMESINTALNGPSKNDYFLAASYYHQEKKDLNKAFEWIKKACEGANVPYYYLRRMSLIQADLGDKAGAIATAQKSLSEAEKAGNADYIKMNKESIAQWQQQ